MKITKDTLKQLIKEVAGTMGMPLARRAAGAAAQKLNLTDEEADFQRARELERATDAGVPRTDREAASRRRAALSAKNKATMARIQARDLPKRSMGQKSQDPALSAKDRARAKKRKRSNA